MEQFFLKFSGNSKDSKDSKEKQKFWSSVGAVLEQFFLKFYGNSKDSKDSKEKSSFGTVLEQFFRVDYLVLLLPLTPTPFIP